MGVAMTSDNNKGIPNLGAVLSKLARRSESKSDSAPPSPVVGLRKAVSGESQHRGALACTQFMPMRSTTCTPLCQVCTVSLVCTPNTCCIECSSALEPEIQQKACMHAGTDMTTTPNPLLTPYDRKKAAGVGLRKWVRFASDGETTIMQVRGPC